MIAEDLADKGDGEGGSPVPNPPEPPSQEVLGATWGLVATRGNVSNFSGSGIKVAILDTGFDLGHPDFGGRPIVSANFVGEPVKDLNDHGTHCTGTACGRKAPAGTTPRYGIAHQSNIHIGKVLTISGGGTTETANRDPHVGLSRRSRPVGCRRPGQQRQEIDWPIWLYFPADRHRSKPDRGAFNGLKLP